MRPIWRAPATIPGSPVTSRSCLRIRMWSGRSSVWRRRAERSSGRAPSYIGRLVGAGSSSPEARTRDMPKDNGKEKDNGTEKLKGKEYAKELLKLQGELCVLQEWVKAKGLRVIIIFEGRDAAGKGGTIKAINERVRPR